MSEYETLLLLGQRVDRTGVHDDKRVVEADGAGVHEWCLRDVQLRPGRPIERLEDLGINLIEARALTRAHPNGVGQKELANAALAEEARDLSHDFVEAGNGAQCVERGAIGGMLPGARGDLREIDARHFIKGLETRA